MPTETVRTITIIDLDDEYDQQEVYVGDDPDGLGLVAVACKTDYYGDISFVMNPDMAEAVAKAMLEQVKYIKEKQ